MDNIIERIKVIIEKEQIPSTVFAENIDVKQSTFSHILTGRNKPSLDVVMKIHRRYNYINLNWLLYGDGPMMVAESGSDEWQQSQLRPNEKKNSYNQSENQSDTDLTLPLFGQNLVKPGEGPEEQKKRREMPLETPVNIPKETVIQEIKYIERPHRKITEIRIFFDDNTYETFSKDS